MSTGEGNPRPGGAISEHPSVGPRRFPVIDPEPPPVPWLRRARWIIPAALVLAGAGFGLATVASPEPGRASSYRGTNVALPGRILVLKPNAELAMSTPGGKLSEDFRQFGTFEQVPPAVSPDHRYLVLPSGQVLRVGPTGLSPSGLGMTSAMGPDFYIQPVAPFSDGDRYLVVRQSNGYPGRQPAEPVQLQPLGGGTPVDLGSAADAAGDPAAPGAFVTIAVTTPVASSQPIVSPPDSTVERRDAGQAPVPLGTAAQLLSDVAAPSSQLSLFDVYPSPDGSQVAVSIAADSSTPSDSGLVVLDRDGHLIGDVPAGLGPSGSSMPVWSPDGRTLAYLTDGSSGPELSMWEVGGSTMTVSLNPASANEPVCLWAPDGSGVLFSSVASGAPGADQFRTDWTVVLRNGATFAAVGGGYPLAWLPPAS